jgi:hypothetical protein
VVVVVVVVGGCTGILHFHVPVEIRANLISTKPANIVENVKEEITIFCSGGFRV